MIINKYTCIFLGNNTTPTKLLMLKRSSERIFAPNFYTGLGGKTEEGETQDACALRELFEESGLENISLTQFAQVIVNNEKLISYYFGVLKNESVPDCPEGTLSWINIEHLFAECEPIILTTKLMVEEWQKRDWTINKPFSLFITRARVDAHEEIPSKLELQEKLILL